MWNSIKISDPHITYFANSNTVINHNLLEKVRKSNTKVHNQESYILQFEGIVLYVHVISADCKKPRPWLFMAERKNSTIVIF